MFMINSPEVYFIWNVVVIFNLNWKINLGEECFSFLNDGSDLIDKRKN